MPIKVQNKKKKNKSSIYKFIVILIAILGIAFILNIAPNYIRDELKDKVNLVVNNKQITANLKNDILIKDGNIYISEDDIRTFFDNDIYYDKDYDQIVTTSDTKVATLPINSKNIIVNGAKVKIYDTVIIENEKRYIPFLSISKIIYNIESTYIEETNTVVAVSLDRKLITADTLKKCNVKYKPTKFSKTVDKIRQGENVTIVGDTTDIENAEWIKVTTSDGKIGYIKRKAVTNIQVKRDDFTIDKQIEGKVSLVWEYFSEYSSAPKRTEKIEGINVVSPSFITLKEQGKGEINVNIGSSGEEYIKWAHNNGYRVWTMASNNSFKDTTSEIINDYKLRQKLIENLLNVVEKYNIDGINLDFENIYEKDKDAYTKLVMELAPRLREMGKVLSVDVTAPDGSPDWSLCYDRNKIAKISDYIIFMAYDQNGISSTEPGTTAGYDWVVTGIKKFVDQNREAVDNNKLILAMPFYTRLWKTSGEKIESSTVSMKNTYKVLPSDANPVWDSDLHQYYIEYTKNGFKYQMWIEDIKSLTDKIKLIDEYNLAGSAFWVKGMEDESIWQIVKKEVLKNNE